MFSGNAISHLPRFLVPIPYPLRKQSYEKKSMNITKQQCYIKMNRHSSTCQAMVISQPDGKYRPCGVVTQDRGRISGRYCALRSCGLNRTLPPPSIDSYQTRAMTIIVSKRNANRQYIALIVRLPISSLEDLLTLSRHLRDTRLPHPCHTQTWLLPMAYVLQIFILLWTLLG